MRSNYNILKNIVKIYILGDKSLHSNHHVWTDIILFVLNVFIIYG